MKTVQAWSTREPKLLECELVLTIQCKCGALRTFRCANSHALVTDRSIAGFTVATTCEECSNIITVAYGWQETGDRFSYRRPEFLIECQTQLQQTNAVDDDQGLSLPSN